MVKVRTASTGDAQGIVQIYGPHVLHDACTFETKIPSIDEMESRITKCLRRFPWIVCEIENQVAGYVYASSHREREAYQWTCESSVYVHDDFKGKGIGRALYKALFQILKTQGLVNVYAGITLPNAASVILHEACGFTRFAEYNNIGFKLGSWHKVAWWGLRLNDYEPKPTPPFLFFEMDASLLATLFEEAVNIIKKKMVNGK